MSPRYQRHLRLPDKAIGWLDTAAVRAEIDRRPEVRASDVVSVISQTARIPEDMVFRDVNDRFRDIEVKLAQRIIGQRDAVRAVAERPDAQQGPAQGRLRSPGRRAAVPRPDRRREDRAGEGRRASSCSATRRRWSASTCPEYQDGAVAVDKLIGMPRGIVGSERGGVLTNQLRDNPYSVILLDEIEKASPSMLNVFLQAFDEGWITDGRGKRVYLSDAIVIMTSNLGAEHFRKLTSPFGFRPAKTSMQDVECEVMREMERRFSPEFRNRIDEVVLFTPLTREEVRQIAEQHLGRIAADAARAPQDDDGGRPRRSKRWWKKGTAWPTARAS